MNNPVRHHRDAVFYDVWVGRRLVGGGSLDAVSALVARGIGGDAEVIARGEKLPSYRVSASMRALVYVPKAVTS